MIVKVHQNDDKKDNDNKDAGHRVIVKVHQDDDKKDNDNKDAGHRVITKTMKKKTMTTKMPDTG